MIAAWPLAAQVKPGLASSYFELKSERARTAAKALTKIQPKSIAQEREYCGVLFVEGGKLYASKPAKGANATCSIRFRDHTQSRIVATYHTHSNYSAHIDSEIPSLVDLSSARRSNLDDYIATPGGRLWHIDARSQTVRLICGLGCLPQDPRFVKCAATMPALEYDEDGLDRRRRNDVVPCPTRPKKGQVF